MVEQVNHICLLVRAIARSCAGLGNQTHVNLLQVLMHGKFLVILLPNGLKLLLLLTVLIDLLFKLHIQLLDLFLKFFDLGLLKVEQFALKSLILILADLIWLHSSNLLSQIVELRLL